MYHYLKYVIFHGYQVVRICEFHNDLSFALSAAANTKIEVLPSLFYLHISSPFNFLLFPRIYNSLHSSCLQIYQSVRRIIHSFLIGGFLVKSALALKIQRIVDQNSSLTCGWELIWKIYCKLDTNLGGFNTYLDEQITTISILPNEDLTEFSCSTLTIHKIIDHSKAVISTNILIKRYFDILVSCLTISPFLYGKQDFSLASFQTMETIPYKS